MSQRTGTVPGPPLVRDGLVPAPLIHANSGYLRAYQAVREPEGNYLQFYAADVARGELEEDAGILDALAADVVDDQARLAR